MFLLSQFTAGNAPPTANAGPDLVIKLPSTDALLDGRGSTDDVGVVRYRWRLRDGDSDGVVLDGDRSDVLQVAGLGLGEYKFSLTVSDAEGERDTDYVSVMVEEGKN